MESNLDFKIHVQKFCFFWQVHFVYYQTSSVGKTISLKQVPGFGRGNTHSVGWWQQKSCHWQFDSVLFYWDKGISSILAMNKSNNVCRLEASDQVLSTSLAAGTSHQKLMWTRTCSLKTFCEEIDSFCRKSAHTCHNIYIYSKWVLLFRICNSQIFSHFSDSPRQVHGLMLETKR